MIDPKSKSLCLFFLCITGGWVSLRAQASNLDYRIQLQIAKVNSSKSPTAEMDAAEELFDLVKGKDLSKVNIARAHTIAHFLNSDFDGIRLWTAATLGEFGPRARFAVPSLLAILPKVDCLRVDASSAYTVRVALKKIGVDPPPPAKCSQLIFPK